MMSKFVGAGDRHKMGFWTELVEVRENRASVTRNQDRICSSEASARSLLDLVVPSDWPCWTPTFGHPESVREGNQGRGAAEVEKEAQS